jgi:hypothetical protein
LNRKLILVLALLTVSFSFLTYSNLASATTVFSDNFSSGNFAGWSETCASYGSALTISDGVAHFTVPTPAAGYSSYSFVRKDGFTSTVNSTIVASEDVYVAKVPSGCLPGNGAIFFFYVCDSTDLSGSHGNFGVGIDGSSVWALWIGGNLTYTYVFQSAGSTPVSGIWYHVVLTFDNSLGTVSLAVNGVVVIAVAQQQFTDKTHPISLMAGMGEDWWSAGFGQQGVAIDNVRLDISDAPTPTISPATPAPTSGPTSNPTATSIPGQNLDPAPTQTPAPTPRATPKSSTSPTPTPQPLPAQTQHPNPTIEQKVQSEFPSWVVLLPVPVGLTVCIAIALIIRKR